MIFNNVIFPHEFKSSKVLPLHKKGDKYQLDNYHLISIISIFSKIIEEVLKKCWYDYFDKHNFFNKSQVGFRKECSTTQAVLNIVLEVVKGLEGGNHTAITMWLFEGFWLCFSYYFIETLLLWYKGYSIIPTSIIYEIKRLILNLLNMEFLRDRSSDCYSLLYIILLNLTNLLCWRMMLLLFTLIIVSIIIKSKKGSMRKRRHSLFRIS